LFALVSFPMQVNRSSIRSVPMHLVSCVMRGERGEASLGVCDARVQRRRGVHQRPCWWARRDARERAGWASAGRAAHRGAVAQLARARAGVPRADSMQSVHRQQASNGRGSRPSLLVTRCRQRQLAAHFGLNHLVALVIYFLLIYLI